MLTETEFSLSSKKETEFIEHCVKPLGVEYDTQYYLKDLHHFCDVFIKPLCKETHESLVRGRNCTFFSFFY